MLGIYLRGGVEGEWLLAFRQLCCMELGGRVGW